MLTKEKYEAIIFMLNGGASDEIIMKSQAINENTLNRVKKSAGNYNTYRELHGQMVKNANFARSNKGEQRQSVTVQATHYMESELRSQTELMKIISNKLTNIMENMEAVKECWK